DDRQQPGLLVALQPLADLVAGETRHHHVEQHEIEGRRIDLAQRLLTGGGALDRITFLLEIVGDELHVHRIVVDDENPRALVIELLEEHLTHAGLLPLFVPFRNAATVAANSRTWIGLVTNPSQPAARAFSSSPFIACAVTATTGMPPRRGSARLKRAASSPSKRASSRSMSISAGGRKGAI